MRRRSFIKLAGAAAVALPFPKPALAQAVTLRWWYHFDNPQNSPAAFIAKFEKDNPGIKISSRSDSVGRRHRLRQPHLRFRRRRNAARHRTGPPELSLAAHGDGRHHAARRLSQGLVRTCGYFRRSVEAEHREGRQEVLCARALCGSLPCYRTDLFREAGLQPPKTFEEFRTCAKALTKGDIYGFGMRGGAGGFDNWGPFVLGGGASFDKGGW